MTDPAGQLLSLPPPSVAADALAEAALRYWDLSGTLHSLTSERDQNHRLDCRHGSFTLKLANPAEDPGLTEFQTLALQHVARTAPALPVPRVVPTSDGRCILATPEGALRLLTWLPGTPVAHMPRTPDLAAAIGTALGQLDATLSGFDHPAADHHLLWDIRNTPDLAPLLPALPPELLAQATAFVTRFKTETAPALARLPRQVIHGDFNPHNLLADPSEPRVLTGILDFGDMTRSHRICDLAVAASYLIDTAEPQRLLMPLVAGYNATNPLAPQELELLPDLITARLVTTLAISAWRAARYPQNAPYILRNAPVSRAGLAALAGLDPVQLAKDLTTSLESQKP
jgi:Ser/Thr protein kinase RdoA (MazF antagonist)